MKKLIGVGLAAGAAVASALWVSAASSTGGYAPKSSVTNRFTDLTVVDSQPTNILTVTSGYVTILDPVTGDSLFSTSTNGLALSAVASSSNGVLLLAMDTNSSDAIVVPSGYAYAAQLMCSNLMVTNIYGAGHSLYLGDTATPSNLLHISISNGVATFEQGGTNILSFGEGGVTNEPVYTTVNSIIVRTQIVLPDTIADQNYLFNSAGALEGTRDGAEWTNILGGSVVGAVAEATNATYATHATNVWGVLSSTNLPDPMQLGEIQVGTLVLTNGLDGTNITGTVTNSAYASAALWATNIAGGGVSGAVGLATLAVGATNDDAGDKISTTYLKENQTITLSGDGTGSGTTSIAVTVTNAAGTFVAAVFDSKTNTWTADDVIPLGATNYFISSGAATMGITGIGNASTSTARFGVLDIVATGDITFTNEAGFRTSDFVDTRKITNGNSAQILVNYIPGQGTNLSIVQFK